jgi:hypothetical protein
VADRPFNPRRAFARLTALLEAQDAKQVANVEIATRVLDPVTRATIMDAARKDANFVSSYTARMFSCMLSNAVDSVGRELPCHERLRMTFSDDADCIPCRPRDFEVVPASRLRAAKEHFSEMLEAVDRVAALARRKIGSNAEN